MYELIKLLASAFIFFESPLLNLPRLLLRPYCWPCWSPIFVLHKSNLSSYYCSNSILIVYTVGIFRVNLVQAMILLNCLMLYALWKSYRYPCLHFIYLFIFLKYVTIRIDIILLKIRLNIKYSVMQYLGENSDVPLNQTVAAPAGP